MHPDGSLQGNFRALQLKSDASLDELDFHDAACEDVYIYAECSPSNMKTWVQDGAVKTLSSRFELFFSITICLHRKKVDSVV